MLCILHFSFVRHVAESPNSEMWVFDDPNYMSSQIIQDDVFVLHLAPREQTGNPRQRS